MMKGRCNAVRAIAIRTFLQMVESPIAYVVGIFFFAFVGGLFGSGYFVGNQASIQPFTGISPWVLWFLIPALTMSLISDEFRLGTFEHLATLPLHDWEIVLGKYAGFAMLVAIGMAALSFFIGIMQITVQPTIGIDWGSSIGVLVGLYLMCLSFGAMGLFASSMTRSPVVALIFGSILCTFFFFASQFYALFGPLSRAADAIGVLSHVDTMGRGVWDLRDILYFASVIFFFLYLTVQRLNTRRF